jgi:hypothetical protein
LRIAKPREIASAYSRIRRASWNFDRRHSGLVALPDDPPFARRLRAKVVINELRIAAQLAAIDPPIRPRPEPPPRYAERRDADDETEEGAAEEAHEEARGTTLVSLAGCKGVPMPRPGWNVGEYTIYDL